MQLFLTSTNNLVTKHFVKHLKMKPEEMRLTFIPTAAEVEEGDLSWLDADRQALVDAGFQVADFTLTNKSSDEVSAMLSETDFFFVSGGNTFYLLQEMKKSGFDSLIKPYLENGGVYGGTSAGSVVVGTDISPISLLDDPADAPELTSYAGLGLVDMLIFPHWGSDHFAKRYQHFFDSAYDHPTPVVLLRDEQYVYVEDGKFSVQGI